MTETDSAVCFVCILLIPAAVAGIAAVNAGLGRARNAAQSMLSSMCFAAAAAIAYFVVGFVWQSYVGGPSRVLLIGGKPWDWIGAARPFFLGLDLSSGAVAPLFGMMSAALAAIIPIGGGGERWRLGVGCASAAFLGGVTFPLFAHWTWGGGFLARLGQNYGIGRGFIDAGGAASIHAVGGVTALAMAWILGARRGKYLPNGMPSAIPGHHATFVLGGCLLAWIGVLGLDCAGAILFDGASWRVGPLVVVNATLSAGAALLAVAWITRLRYRKVDASLSANGWVAGLAASSAGCASMAPAGAMIVGLVAGAIVVFGVEWLELHLHVDDPGGAVPVHLLAAVWGVLAAGPLARNAGPDQWLAQVAGVATSFGFVLPVAYGANWMLNRFLPQRVSAEGERHGMDLHELGAGAYPDFMSYQDE
ncbi:MAG: hypothetical protein JSU00_15470 [Acidobacteria bacterium]|nr:hypothetical protein [Acidobacteriota bacterium]